MRSLGADEIANKRGQPDLPSAIKVCRSVNDVDSTISDRVRILTSPTLDFEVLLLDIEGTITPINFVHDTLFPFARLHVREFLERKPQRHSVQQDLVNLQDQYRLDTAHGLTPPRWDGSSFDSLAIEAYTHWLMDHGRKVAPLKSLQGKIWEFGYENGTVRGRIFPDVLPAFQRLRNQNKPIYLFSSGSVLAQQLLIRHSEFGDLSEFINGFFDMTTGAKADFNSYATIAETIGVRSSDMLFVSDVVLELDAAQTVGMNVRLSQRPGNIDQPESSYERITSFDSLCGVSV